MSHEEWKNWSGRQMKDFEDWKEGKLKVDSVDDLHDEIARLKKLVYDAWWEGHRAGEDDTMAYERGYRSKAPVWETSDSFKELHGVRK